MKNAAYIILSDYEESELFIYKIRNENPNDISNFKKSHSKIGSCTVGSSGVIAYDSFQKARNMIYHECKKTGWSYNPDKNRDLTKRYV